MNTIDAPYSIAPEGEEEGEFDLYNLGPTTVVFVGGGRGQMAAVHQVAVKDYDELFAKKLLKIDPPHRVHAFLDHHLQHSIEKLGGASAFLDHFKYAILHPLQHHTRSPHVAAAGDWFTKTMDNIHKQHQVAKAKFLSRAFELALERDPARPTKVVIQLEEMAGLMEMDIATAKRMRDELTQDGLVRRVANYPVFIVEPEGRRAVERMHAEPPTMLPNIAISTGDGSPVVVQALNHNATQTVNIGDEIQEARTFTDRLSAALTEIQKVAPPDQFTEITDELEFLKKKLDSPTPPKTMIKTIKDELIKRLIGLPFDAAKWFGPEILQGLS